LHIAVAPDSSSPGVTSRSGKAALAVEGPA